LIEGDGEGFFRFVVDDTVAIAGVTKVRTSSSGGGAPKAFADVEGLRTCSADTKY
jgi:hypothetical protein